MHDEGWGRGPHWLLGMLLLHLWRWLLHDKGLLLGMLLHDNNLRGLLVHLWWRDC